MDIRENKKMENITINNNNNPYTVSFNQMIVQMIQFINYLVLI